MDKNKRIAIEQIVDTTIKSFVDGFTLRYDSEVDDPNGVINSKKNNCFIAELGDEFIFYSAFVRSFDSSFGKVLENLGNAIAQLSYEVRDDIESFLLPQQTQHSDYLMNEYERHTTLPKISDYDTFNCLIPADITSYKKKHKTDNYFYKPATKEHFIIELKAGGDLDNKKAKAEKLALLNEFFILKNKLNNNEEKIKIFFATAYNKFGEGHVWKQANVQTFFAMDELLIGKDYWNFVCDDKDGFDIIFEQYRKSSEYMKEALNRIKKKYFEVKNK